MRAAVYTEYGPPEVLHFQDVEKPTPKDDEVLIKVHATTVSTGDCNVRGFTFIPPGFGPLPRLMFGIRKPRNPILGVVLAGEIEAVGKDVTHFKPGDPVYGIDGGKMGAYAEYACRAESSALAIKPANLSYEEAAAIPFGAGTALSFLRDKGHIKSGHDVLVHGASGGVGSYAVQLAKHFGATVTGVCSTPNVDWVKSLGADRVIDYTQEDFTQNSDTYDIIFDSAISDMTFAKCKHTLKEQGRYLAIAGGLGAMLQAPLTAMLGGKQLAAGAVPENKEDLDFLRGLIEDGAIKPMIDKCYPFEDLVEAHRYVDGGHKRGCVVVTLTPNTP